MAMARCRTRRVSRDWTDLMPIRSIRARSPARLEKLGPTLMCLLSVNPNLRGEPDAGCGVWVVEVVDR